MQSFGNGTYVNDYKIIRLIDRGGMGEVYEAYEGKLDRIVAIKVIAPSVTGGFDQKDLIRRFFREARALAKINHPNVVTIHAIESVAENFFIVMEYVEGVSMRALRRHWDISLDCALVMFDQMLRGLKGLHDNRIIHRDLKPQNILVRVDGQIKILDLGIAKRQDATDRSGPVCGTVRYMAPEVRKGLPATNQSDFWSLGAIFFECLIGRPLMALNGTDKNEFSNSDFLNLPHGIRNIIHGMSATKPEDRYANVCEIIDLLQNYRNLQGRPVESELETISEKIKSMLSTPLVQKRVSAANHALELIEPRPRISRVPIKTRALLKKRNLKASLPVKRSNQEAMFRLVTGVICGSVITLSGAKLLQVIFHKINSQRFEETVISNAQSTDPVIARAPESASLFDRSLKPTFRK